MDQPQPLPNPAESFRAAVRAFSARDWAQAEVLCQQVLLANPRHADALQMLGLVFGETGRLEEAIAKLRAAIALTPASAVLWTNLGEAYRKAGWLADAIECHRKAIGLQENSPEAHYNLGLAYRGLGQFEDAIVVARRATELRPRYAKAHYLLGNLLREAGRYQEALAAYQAALQARPDWPDAHLNIAAAWLALEEPVQALAHYREILRLNPAHRDAEYSIGHVLRALGRVEEAKAAYARAAAGTAESRMSVLVRETLAEVIAPDHAAISQYKAQVAAAVAAFAADPGELDLSSLHARGAVPSMMLACYGGDMRPILERYAQAIGPRIPRLPLRRRQGKPKLGIVVTRHEDAFARCWGGIAERLSRESFDVRLLCSRGGANILQAALRAPQDAYLPLPSTIDEALRLIQEQEFDWLHYWQIGTDPLNYYLPFFRPAAGQSGCWGWPLTSGNPHVNSYLSCEQLEPPDGAAHYTEQLVLLKRLPTYYVRPPAPSGPLLRSRFGLGDSEHVYFCTQNLRKYHPDFDPLLADLLRTDPQGVLLITADRQASITELLLSRFRRTMPDAVSRVRVIPRMERPEYLALVAVSDVVLDTLHFGAGAETVYDAVAMGAPLVTLPGEFHRSRWGAAVNRRLGLDRLIASTPEDYVAAAVAVARDADLRQSLRRQILDAGADLFEDASVISEHETYFSEAIAASRAADQHGSGIASQRADSLTNWVFLDKIDLDYDVAAPLTTPIGGAQSAMCYLATALAGRGHKVTTFTGTMSPRVVAGVRCLSNRTLPLDVFAPANTVLVVVSGDADRAVQLRQILPRGPALVLWTGHAYDQPAMQALLNPSCAALWDRIVCVSDWQRTMFHRCLHVPEGQLEVLRNAIAPAFERLFRDMSDLAAAKSPEPRLAYTSTPFRGLDVLVSCFPEIRRRQPQCRLEVFSSMRVYGLAGPQDEYQSLYNLCRATEGIDYRGSVSQKQLADELRGVHVLAYPNTFAETSCIAVMEALAAGALIVTSDLGALPETCGGWAKLVPSISAERPREQFERDFVNAVAATLDKMQSDWPAAMRERYQQAEAINTACTWSVRAAEWEAAAARWMQTPLTRHE